MKNNDNSRPMGADDVLCDDATCSTCGKRRGELLALGIDPAQPVSNTDWARYLAYLQADTERLQGESRALRAKIHDYRIEREALSRHSADLRTQLAQLRGEATQAELALTYPECSHEHITRSAGVETCSECGLIRTKFSGWLN